MKNYVEFRCLSPFRKCFFFIDTEDYLADGLFIKHRVAVKFKREFVHPGSPYIVIEITCRKKDCDRVIAALGELSDKAIIMGYTDYHERCEQIRNIIDK